MGSVPLGYGWGWVSVAVFAAGGVGDILWHLAFGTEASLGALVSPTHMLLLTGGTLLLTSRCAQLQRPHETGGPR